MLIFGYSIRRKVVVCLVVFLLLAFLQSSSFAQLPMKSEAELPIVSEAAVLMEVHNGTVLYEKNAGKPLHPASIAKIMTLLLVGEAIDEGIINWDDTVTVSLNAYRMNIGSRMFLEHNQRVTVADLVKGIAIISGNDACVAIAEHIAGSEENFVKQMNRRADELGMIGSNFVNSHGLHDPKQTMSALDIAVLSAFFLNTQPEIAAFQSEKEWTFNDIRQYNRNPLLDRYEGASGIKTGYIAEAGWCLAATAERNGLRLISVIMKSPDSATRASDSQLLLNHGFSRYILDKRAFDNTQITSVPVVRGDINELGLYPLSDIDIVLPKDQEIYLEEEISLEEKIVAPLEKGTILGKITFSYDNEELFSVELAAGEDVERLGFFAYIWRSFINLFRRG